MGRGGEPKGEQYRGDEGAELNKEGDLSREQHMKLTHKRASSL